MCVCTCHGITLIKTGILAKRHIILVKIEKTLILMQNKITVLFLSCLWERIRNDVNLSFCFFVFKIINQ